MSNTIIELRHSYVTGNVPSSLANGEIAINTYDGKLFYRGGPSNTIQTIERYSGPAGLDTEIQFNDSGVLGSSANLTFDKLTGLFTTGNVTANTVTTRDYIQFGDGTRQYSANDQIARDTASAAYLHANAGFIVANDAFGFANVGIQDANTAHYKANAAFIQANAAFDIANNNAAINVTQNTNIQFAWNHANAAFNQANTGSGSPAGSNQQVQFNNNGAFGASSGLTYDGVSLKVNGNLESVYQNGDEGGEIYLNKAVTNTTLAAGVTIDVYQNKLRIFENAGTNRGVFIDIANGASAGVGTNLLNPSSTPDTEARNTANAAFIAANSAGSYANSAFDSANTKTYTYVQDVVPTTANVAGALWQNTSSGIVYMNFGNTSNPVWAEL